MRVVHEFLGAKHAGPVTGQALAACQPGTVCITNHRHKLTRMSCMRSACTPVVDVVFSHACRAASSGAPSCRGSGRSCLSSFTTKGLHAFVGAAYTYLARRTATKRSCNAVGNTSFARAHGRLRGPALHGHRHIHFDTANLQLDRHTKTSMTTATWMTTTRARTLHRLRLELKVAPQRGRVQGILEALLTYDIRRELLRLLDSTFKRFQLAF